MNRKGNYNAQKFTFGPEIVERLEYVNEKIEGGGNLLHFWQTFMDEFHPGEYCPGMSTVYSWLKKAGLYLRPSHARPTLLQGMGASTEVQLPLLPTNVDNWSH